MFPRINTALSTYLKNSRCCTGASVALTAAVAAGVGAVGTTAGTQPWIASLNSMAQSGHASVADAASPGTAKVLDVDSPSHAADAPSASGSRPAARPSAPARAANNTRQAAAPGYGVQALRPLPSDAATKALAPAAHAAAHGKAVLAPLAAPRKAASAPGPYTIYDSVSPGQIPSRQQQVAVYGNGSYQASWSAVHGRHKVLWIDTNASNPGCDALDVEPGDASPAAAARWVDSRLHQQPGSIAIVYTMRSEWSAVKAAIRGLSGQEQSHVRYWIADPTGVRHIVPGASATQWYWGSNYDITQAQPNFAS